MQSIVIRAAASLAPIRHSTPPAVNGLLRHMEPCTTGKIQLGEFVCPAQCCIKRFGTALEVFKHAKTLQKPRKQFFPCPVPLCSSAMRGPQISKSILPCLHQRPHQARRYRLGRPARPSRSGSIACLQQVRSAMDDGHVGVVGQDRPDRNTSDNLEQDPADELSMSTMSSLTVP